MSASKKPEVWPVIHLESPSQGIANARVAADCGCPGVFLISMDGRDDIIDLIADGIRSRLPGLRIGANYLSMKADAAIARSLQAGHDATWTDDAGIRSQGPTTLAENCRRLLDGHPDHLFFAAVAFKYQRPESDPVGAAVRAMHYGFVPTTSGAATGSAPDVAKLAGMRSGLGSYPLAVASGVTPDNVRVLGPHLSHILVATGVSKTFHDFDETKLRDLMSTLPERIDGNGLMATTGEPT